MKKISIFNLSMFIFLVYALNLCGMEEKEHGRKRSHSCGDSTNTVFSNSFFDLLLVQVMKDEFNNFDILTDSDLIDLFKYIDEKVYKFISLQDISESAAKLKAGIFADILIDKLIKRAIFVATEDDLKVTFVESLTKKIEGEFPQERAKEFKVMIARHSK